MRGHKLGLLLLRLWLLLSHWLHHLCLGWRHHGLICCGGARGTVTVTVITPTIAVATVVTTIIPATVITATIIMATTMVVMLRRWRRPLPLRR